MEVKGINVSIKGAHGFRIDINERFVMDSLVTSYDYELLIK